MPVKRGVEAEVSTAREGPGRGGLPGGGGESRSSSNTCGRARLGLPPLPTPPPRADAIPPCLHLWLGAPGQAWVPGPGGKSFRGGPPRLLGMTSPTGIGTAGRGICAPVVASFHQHRPRSRAPWGGTGSAQGRRRAHRLHVAGTWAATVLHGTSESRAKGQRRESATGQNGLVRFFPGVTPDPGRDLGRAVLTLRTTWPGWEAQTLMATARGEWTLCSYQPGWLPCGHQLLVE